MSSHVQALPSVCLLPSPLPSLQSLVAFHLGKGDRRAAPPRSTCPVLYAAACSSSLWVA